jgi:hypothetical protein
VLNGVNQRPSGGTIRPGTNVQHGVWATSAVSGLVCLTARRILTQVIAGVAPLFLFWGNEPFVESAADPLRWRSRAADAHVGWLVLAIARPTQADISTLC